jgi:hypothetical protein
VGDTYPDGSNRKSYSDSLHALGNGSAELNDDDLIIDKVKVKLSLCLTN